MTGQRIRTVRFKHAVTLLPGDNIRMNGDNTFDHIRHYPPGTFVLHGPLQMTKDESIIATPDGGIDRIWSIEFEDE